MSFLKKVYAAKAVTGSIDGLLEKMRSIVSSDKFLSEWMNDAESMSGSKEFWERIGAEKTDEMSDDEFLAEVKERADEYLDDLWADFEAEFESDAEGEGSNLIGYRCISLRDVEKFIEALKKGEYLEGYSGLGIFFSWQQGAEECHWGSGESSVTLKASIPISSIDIKRTVRANMRLATGNDEKEITLKKGAKFLVLEILDEDGNNLLEDVKPLRVVAHTRL